MGALPAPCTAPGRRRNIITKAPEKQTATVGLRRHLPILNNCSHFDFGKIGWGLVAVQFNRLRRLMEPQDTNMQDGPRLTVFADYHFTDHDSLNIYGDY